MKMTFLFLLIVPAFYSSKAQGKQIKMYLEQIAANKVYIEYLQKGYATVKKGLGTINTIKGGHLSLDELFFHGLVAINPKIRQYPRASDSYLLAARIRRVGKEILQRMKGDTLFTGDQIVYAQQVVVGLNNSSAALLRDLDALLTAGSLQLSDDERVKRIDQVFDELDDRYQFICSWSDEVTILLLRMKHTKQDVQVMKKITEVK